MHSPSLGLQCGKDRFKGSESQCRNCSEMCVEHRVRNAGLGFCSLPIHGLTHSSAEWEGPPCIDFESSWIIHQVKSSHHPKHMPRINMITSVGDQQVWRQRAALVAIQSHGALCHVELDSFARSGKHQTQQGEGD